MRAHPVRPHPVEPPSGAGDPRLIELIREEIADSGPVTFARFMGRALYEPELGYYATSTERTSPGGDFVTAPELHPVFGWTIARQVDEMWRRLDRPGDFVLREYGAGNGALILSLLEGLALIDSPLAKAIRYDPIDLPAQRALIGSRLEAADHGACLVVVDEAAGSAAAAELPITGLILANEYLDALPVHRVVGQDGELREIYVDWHDDAFVEVTGEPSTDDLKAWFLDAGVTLADGQQAEVNLGLLDWIDLVEAELERGYVLAIDYGAGSVDLYGPTRQTGTLRSFAGQRVSSDVLHGVGRRDITAHVDFGTLERAASVAGFDVLGRRKVNEFLLAAGLDDAYAAARVKSDEDWDSALLLRAAVRRLLDPGALGGYHVAVLAKSLPPATGSLSGLRALQRQADAH